jgi:hypothetical protein
MKTSHAILALLAVPSCIFAAEKPDGVIGTDYVNAFYTYYSDNYGYYNMSDETFNGFGVGVNKNVINGEKYRVDAGMKYYYVHSLDNGDVYDYTQNTIAASGTVFMKGMVSPFVGATVFYHFSDVDYKGTDSFDDSDTSWVVSGKVGVEIHLMPGLSGTVFVAESHDCDGDYPANSTQYGFSVAYWFTGRMGLSVGETYISTCHIDEYATTVSLMYHF